MSITILITIHAVINAVIVVIVIVVIVVIVVIADVVIADVVVVIVVIAVIVVIVIVVIADFFPILFTFPPPSPRNITLYRSTEKIAKQHLKIIDN